MARWRKEPHQNFEAGRAMILAAFKDLRKRGFVARANYLCCGGCAGYAIASNLDAKVKADPSAKLPVGCAYWHRQDDDTFQKTGALDIRYGQIECSGTGAVTPMETKAVGQCVVAMLLANGIPPSWIDWDGDPGKVIAVKVGEFPKPLAPSDFAAAGGGL